MCVTLGILFQTSKRSLEEGNRKVKEGGERERKDEQEKAKNFLNSVGKLISNSIRETGRKSGMIEKDTILLLRSSLVFFFSLSSKMKKENVDSWHTSKTKKFKSAIEKFLSFCLD